MKEGPINVTNGELSMWFPQSSETNLTWLMKLVLDCTAPVKGNRMRSECAATEPPT